MISSDAQPPRLLLDCSLSLVNRTGAHYIAEELAGVLADSVVTRRWRSLGTRLPGGWLRKLQGRLMLKELAHGPGLGVPPWPEPRGPRLRRVFLDPLYVLQSRLESSDVVLCHDIGPITHPQLYDAETVRMYHDAYRRIVRVGPGLVFVSQTSQRAFEAEFGSAFRFLQVIPLYVRSGTVEGARTPVSGVQKPFLLTVGALERRKNQLTAIRAFRESGLSARGFQYILCGARGAGADEILQLARETPGVQVLGYVDDQQLRWLYREATAFVLPSLLEGFGMPALEAAQYGLLPILSRDSALSEAVGGLGIAVAAESSAEIAHAMREVADLGVERRAELGHALVEHAQSVNRGQFVSAWRELVGKERSASRGQGEMTT